jgi:hypothetical protein
MEYVSIFTVLPLKFVLLSILQTVTLFVAVLLGLKFTVSSLMPKKATGKLKKRQITVKYV